MQVVVLTMWRLLLASCTLLSVLQQIAGVSYCPNSEFQIWNGYCYAFVSSPTGTWTTVRSKCQQRSVDNIKVDLASIGSKEEDKFIHDEMKKKIYHTYWIGLKATDGTDIYHWVDGNNGTYRNWGTSQLDSDCVDVSPGAGKWYDYGCTSYSQPYVCKGKAYSGWAKKGDWEYFIDAGSGDESLNWYQARDWCNENGGELASITSDAETDSIYELLKMTGFKNSLWIGLNRLKDDQTKWTWSDGTAYGSYDNWKEDYPTEDNIYRHHCGTVHSDDTTGEWTNAHCGRLDHGFVCKRDPNNIGMKTTPAPVTGGGFCPSGYFEAGDKCFKLYTRNNENGHTWSEAVNFCRNSAGYRRDIATISNPFEQAVINSELQKSSLPLWMGLYRREAGSAEWLWSDNAQYEYTNWGLAEPISSTALCAGVRSFSIPLGSWGNQDCEKKQGFICQMFKNPGSWISTTPAATPNSCTGDYKPYWKGCYKLYTTMVTWEKANTQCMADGANLVSINHGAENGYIQSLANNNVQKMSLWIGLRDSGRTGEYKWTDNWAVLYTRWGDDEPSQNPDTGGCVRLRPGDGTWEDTACTSQNGFVCKTTDEPPVTAPPPSQGRCPSLKGWVEHGSYCYKFHQLASVTWGEASIDCKKDSFLANLASIHHLEENNWIYKQLAATVLSNHVWIGMFRRSDTNGFAWNDLSTVQYEHWAPLEPNGEFMGEDCVGFHKNYPEMWLDQKCSTRQGYVCKSPKVVYPTLPPDGPGFCPPNWVNISNHCYLFNPNLHLEWIQARRFCNSQDTGAADLVTIKDIAEDIFVNTEMFSREDSIGENLQFWIGLTKKKKGADYMWVDGTSTEGYDNWDKGEPSGKDDGSTNCAFQYILNTKWDDADCNEYKGFACKMPKLPDPTLSSTLSSTMSTPGDTTTVGKSPGGSGPSGGAVAGIVIGTLIGVALLGALIFFMFKNNINPVSKAKDFASGFSNPFYPLAEDTKPVKDERVA